MADFNLQKVLDTVRTKIQRGNDLWNSENYADSIKEYKDALVFYNKYNGKPEERRDLRLKIAEGYSKLGDFHQAIKYYEDLMKDYPESPILAHLLATQYEGYDNIKAIQFYIKALELGEEEGSFTSASWLMMKNSSYSQKQIKEFNEKCMDKFRGHYLSKMEPFKHEKRDKNKKLKIGYVSSDFYSHAMMTFLLPILEKHDFQKYDITLYSLSPNNDDVTQRLKNTDAEFVDLSKANQQEIAKRIYQDKIDILIDLTGHNNTKDFYLFYKPAPIQMQYLGYLNTYGMKEVDYIITDKFSIPENQADEYTETPIYLEHGMQKYCFTKENTNLPVIKGIPPVFKNGYLTFGSFNTISKIDEKTIRLWTKLLDEMPKSHLLFYRTQMTEKNKEGLTKMLKKYNADMSRVEFENRPDPSSHFNIYQNADIALDPLPFSGLTISIETMLMGVPILCMAGQTLQSKGTARVNKFLKLAPFVAENDQEFIDKAKELANPEYLLKCRMHLRKIIMNSELFNHYETIAKDFEQCFDKAWKTYCKE